jgi:uncharacterized protein (DUF2141 family)
MKWTPRLALGCLVAAAMSAPDQAEPNGSAITVVVDGVRSSVGSVRVDICTPATFLKSSCPYSSATAAAEGTTSVTVDGVPPGAYAAQVYHDWNNNHTVDRGALGIPTEELGFSRNAFVGLHGPSFAHAAFAHDSEPQVIEVHLHRFNAPRQPPSEHRAGGS